jgi:large subunit ribosomal protein L21
MYAVVNSGGKQYKIQKGEVLRVEKISGDVGSPVTFDRVLLFSDGENISIGRPALQDVVVQGHIVEQGKAKKIIVFKYKRRKRYRRKKGHRQDFTAVMIDSIKAKGTQAKKEAQSKVEPVVEAKKTDTQKASAKKKDIQPQASRQEVSDQTESKKEASTKSDVKKDRS